MQKKKGEYKTEKVQYDDLRSGDVIVLDKNKIATVVKKGTTLLHNHRYIKLKEFCFGYEIEKSSYRIYEHDNAIDFERLTYA